jgi:hypothetical protein
MKIKHMLALLALVSVLFVSSCGSSDNSAEGNKEDSGSNSSPSDNQGSASIPTPSSTPVVYQGETKTYEDLLAAIRQADPASKWAEDKADPEKFDSSEISLRSKDGCYIYGYASFQSAVNHDSGSYGDSWTTLGSYAQLGIILLDGASCAQKLSSVIRFPGLSQPGVDFKLFSASAENISDCLVRHSACLLDEGIVLPGPSENTFKKPLDELRLLSDAGFCAVAVDVGEEPGGRNSCEANPDKPGVTIGAYITEDATDLNILRFAAQEPAESDTAGKFVIYGDGWMVLVFNSTEKYRQLFMEMNKIIKGTLIARY